jgi:hypothetical protein
VFFLKNPLPPELINVVKFWNPVLVTPEKSPPGNKLDEEVAAPPSVGFKRLAKSPDPEA